MTFDIWKNEVNTRMVHQFGFTSDDVEDFLWRDLYDDGINPIEAVEIWAEEVM